MGRQRQLKQATVEIVRVLGKHLLVDAAWNLHRYGSAGGDALKPGLYVALRPAGAKPGFDAGCRYLGPLADPAVARVLQASATSFGATPSKPAGKEEPAPMPRPAAAGRPAPIRWAIAPAACQPPA